MPNPYITPGESNAKETVYKKGETMSYHTHTHTKSQIICIQVKAMLSFKLTTFVDFLGRGIILVLEVQVDYLFGAKYFYQKCLPPHVQT